MSFLDNLFGKSPPRQPYEVFTYRTIDGQGYFKFSYHEIPRGFEIDIHNQPKYKGRKEGSLVSHRLPSYRETKHKICIKKKHIPKTLNAAKDLSVAWAEYTWDYIKTGVTIDTQIEMEQKSKN
jgi:hypothetical protein